MRDLKKAKHSELIKSLAYKAGFQFCGISEATFLANEAKPFEEWLAKGFHGKMLYMENHFDKRLDPRKLVEGSKSVISLAYNYFPQNSVENELKISKYAYGEDYHFVIKDKLKELLQELEKQIGSFGYRIFVDSAPMMDKVWAKKSGLGWVGKNTNLISRTYGSFFFIAEIVCDLPLEYDGPIKDYCGTCTACLDACPTDALVAPYQIDGSKCISYFTIELKDEIPSEMKGKFENWIFGCDICQDVCPWNRFAKATTENRFSYPVELEGFTKKDWQELKEETFQRIFKKSPIKRTKWKGLKRNIAFLE